ncbi:methyltransferase domain-containing protein [Salinarimonas soli]|uniref:Methyltransferase domain-containing protein n=1 Tax=Salinarimonas soli TaxID=1638099 RepID=A0A5B2VEX4_9HYPH|nr:methyltransferase domain-containing protein [Salinarimonas soli]KAA2237000.1 methyltransferase domain-containing protein [Salinarimonas soli]
MPDFASRSTQPELMDEEGIAYEDFRACLRDLAVVNTVTLARPPTLAWLKRATRGMSRFTLLDVGFGQGDMLRTILAWSRRNGIKADLIGVDLNPWSAAAAREATPQADGIEYHTGDVFAFEPQRSVDFVVSSIFTHHLPDDALVRFVAWMEGRAGRGWFVNDLHRLAFPYYGFALLARLARWHRFVQHDGPVSIARSFRPEDWQRAVTGAGLPLDAVEIRPVFPFRLCVGRLR